jgi:hypothetical protein
MVNGSELRMATIAAPTAEVRKVAAIPYPSHGASGPENMSAANDKPYAIDSTLLTPPAKRSWLALARAPPAGGCSLVVMAIRSGRPASEAFARPSTTYDEIAGPTRPVGEGQPARH